MTIPLHHIIVNQCGCNIFYYRGEVTPGRWTQIDSIIMCDEHHTKYWDEKIKAWEVGT